MQTSKDTDLDSPHQHSVPTGAPKRIQDAARLIKELTASILRPVVNVFQIAVQLLILAVGIGVIWDICNPKTTLDVLTVPTEFQNEGYTTELVARRIKDQIEAIHRAQSEGHDLPLELLIKTESPLPDLQIPTVNVSLRTAVIFIRQLLHFPPDTITVEVTRVRPMPTNDSSTVAGNGRELGSNL